MLVLAGPGSGKTTVIINRVANLIKKYNTQPKEILVITFTKTAADEMKNRFYSKFNFKNREVFFGTFHSYFFKIIRSIYNYSLESILKENEKIYILKKIFREQKINFHNEEEFLQIILNNISDLKNELINPQLYNPKNIKIQDFLQIYYKYEEEKKLLNKIDFDDMLLKCYEALKSNEDIRNFWANTYKYILIDEFQDINRVQYECIKMLVNSSNNIFVVGDDDQSIYRFRGSRPEFLLNFEKDFENTKKVILNINYRSTDSIITLCNNIIKENKNRYQKDIKGISKKGSKPTLVRPFDTSQEAKYISKKIKDLQQKYNLQLEEIAIIYRTNIQARAIIESLRDNNIQYQLKDEIFSIYDHWITKDIIAYLNLALNEKSRVYFERIANKPKRYINKAIISEAISNCDENTSIIEYLYCDSQIKPYQLQNLNSLKFNLKQLKNKSAYDAIKYIMKNIEYEDYLEEYADFKNIKIKGLIEILYELLEAAKNHDKIEDFLDYVEDMSYEIKNNKNKENSSGVVLSTIHSVKGLEFNTVFLISCVEGIIPHEKSKSYEEIEEERRLLYVALTRAKERLFVSVIKTKHETQIKPSRFLNKVLKFKE